MSEVEDRHRTEFSDGVVQFRFTDETGRVGDLDAKHLADSLLGLVEFTEALSEGGAFGHEPPPEVRIRPLKEGSVVIEAFLEFHNANPEISTSGIIGTGGLLVAGVKTSIKHLRARPSGVEAMGEDSRVITWSDGSIDEVPTVVWQALNRRKSKTKKALRKILQPLESDVTQLEIRDARGTDDTQELLAAEPDLLVGRRDFRATAPSVSDQLEDVDETFDTEATLRTIHFGDDRKWTLETPRGRFQATIEDDDFLRKLDDNMALHKGDVFDVKVRHVAETTNGRRSQSWSLIRVVRKTRGDGRDGNDHTSELD